METTTTTMLTKLLLLGILAVMVTATTDADVNEMADMEEEWHMWKKQHGKSYSPKEELHRRTVFYKNLIMIREHNAKYPDKVSFTMRLNQNADLTNEEYRDQRGMGVRPSQDPHPVKVHNCSLSKFQAPPDFEVPDTVNWREKGYVTDVMDQGKECSDSYLFASVGAIEGQHFKKTGRLVALSYQQVLDCGWEWGFAGCFAGYAENVYWYVMRQPGGLMSLFDYPYYFPAPGGRPCKFNLSQAVAPISGCAGVYPRGDEDVLKTAVAAIGPISIYVDASLDSFRFYGGGVYSDPACSNLFKPSIKQESYLIVGYGNYFGKDYWLLKSSHGVIFGYLGYMLLARNDSNMCGVANIANYPIV